MSRYFQMHLLSIAVFLMLASCSSTQDASPTSRATAEVSPPGGDVVPTRLPGATRIISFGDIHGDLDAARRSLRLAGLIDDNERWIGGETTVVQTGDILDRGEGEGEIIDLFERLTDEASEAGGSFNYLLGNHELMNIAGDFRYMKASAFVSFGKRGDHSPDPARIASFPEAQRGRATAMLPGGWVAGKLERRNVVMTVGENVFVHAGMLPEHADHGMEQINREARDWISGRVPNMPEILDSRSAPTWTRLYSGDPEPSPQACATLAEALRILGAKRMMVGHTVQEQGINPACDGKVWRIDVGMSAYYGGPVEVLEILNDEPTVLKEKPGVH